MLGMVSSIWEDFAALFTGQRALDNLVLFLDGDCQVKVAPAHGADQYFHQIETHGLVLSLLVSAYGIITSLVMKRWFNSEI